MVGHRPQPLEAIRPSIQKDFCTFAVCCWQDDSQLRLLWIMTLRYLTFSLSSNFLPFSSMPSMLYKNSVGRILACPLFMYSSSVCGIADVCVILYSVIPFLAFYKRWQIFARDSKIVAMILSWRCKTTKTHVFGSAGKPWGKSSAKHVSFQWKTLFQKYRQKVMWRRFKDY